MGKREKAGAWKTPASLSRHDHAWTSHVSCWDAWLRGAFDSFLGVAFLPPRMHPTQHHQQTPIATTPAAARDTSSGTTAPRPIRAA